MAKNQHVVPHGEDWAVRREGATRSTSRHRTQKEAIEVARKIARKDRADVVIHSRGGRVRDRDRYGSDTNPPRERKVLFPRASSASQRRKIEKAVGSALQQSDR